jgi:hypothetical protein
LKLGSNVKLNFTQIKDGGHGMAMAIQFSTFLYVSSLFSGWLMIENVILD